MSSSRIWTRSQLGTMRLVGYELIYDSAHGIIVKYVLSYMYLNLND